jgi:DNA mismatch repair ATPase MutS
VSEVFTNYHFSEEIEDERGVSFDYQLLEGPSTEHNAIKLLRYVGYPDEITKAADRRMSEKRKGEV